MRGLHSCLPACLPACLWICLWIYTEQVVGGKSNNLTRLRAALASRRAQAPFKFPASCALPFGVFEAVLAAAENAAASAAIAKVLRECNQRHAQACARRARSAGAV